MGMQTVQQQTNDIGALFGPGDPIEDQQVTPPGEKLRHWRPVDQAHGGAGNYPPYGGQPDGAPFWQCDDPSLLRARLRSNPFLARIGSNGEVVRW